MTESFIKPRIRDLNLLAWAFTWRYYLIWCAAFMIFLLCAATFPSMHLVLTAHNLRFLFESFLLPMALFQYLFSKKFGNFTLVKVVEGTIFDETAFQARVKNLTFKERIKAGKETGANTAQKLFMKLTWVFVFGSFACFLVFLFLPVGSKDADTKLFILAMDLLLLPFKTFALA